MTKNEKYGLAVLLLISLLLSICLFFRTYVISSDGAFQYIPLAKDFVSGLFGKALSHNQQPFYSLMIAFASRWIPDFETAGKVVSSIFGILLIIPVYFLGKRIFDTKIALLSSFFIVIHPYIRRYSADVLKESTYLFMFMTAIWFAWKTIQNEKRTLFLLIPLFSVLAYLVRPDGIEILLVVFFYILLAVHFSIPGRKKIVLFLLILSSCILLLPYLFYIREMRGEWSFAKAKSVIEMFGLGGGGDHTSFFKKLLYSFGTLNFVTGVAFTQVYVFLLVVSFVKRFFTGLKKGEGYLLSFFCLHYAVLFMMLFNTTRWGTDGTIQVAVFDTRHTLSLLLVSIYWIGDGFITVYQFISDKLDSCSFWRHFNSKRRPFILFAVLLAALLIVVPAKTLKRQRYQRLPEKWAGAWIKDQYGPGMKIVTTLPRVAFYGNGDFDYIDFKKVKFNTMKDYMIFKKSFLLVIRDEEATDLRQNVNTVQKDFVEVARFGGKKMETIFVYKLIQ